jgi:hypothetical protein
VKTDLPLEEDVEPHGDPDEHQDGGEQEPGEEPPAARLHPPITDVQGW